MKGEPSGRATGEPAIGLLRVSVTAEAAGLDERELVARMAAIFPSGVEETRDEQGRFEVAAYETPPLTLPGDLGLWRVEPVGQARIREWEEHQPGQVIGGKLWVGPSFEQPEDGLVPVYIDRKRVFGSGAHATTVACLELLCDVEERGSVLDVGCGSGVLAICAAALGHAPVCACDDDALAIGAAQENVERNGVDVQVFRANGVTDDLPRADLWLANLHPGLLADLLARPDAPERAIVSGLRADHPLDAPGYEVERRLEISGWAGLALRRR
jgi:ribosomal protein L11 methylase PrmA